MRRRAAEHRAPVPRSILKAIWAILCFFSIAGLVLFVGHHYHEGDQVKQLPQPQVRINVSYLCTVFDMISVLF